MHLRRAAAAALAACTLVGLGACTKNDNGNNTLVGRKAEPTSSGGPQTTAPAEAGGELKLEAKDNEFAPTTLTAKAGDISFEMNNTGKAPHTFTSTELGVDVNVNAGEKGTVSIKDAKPGTYAFFCKYHEALGMKGEITVT